MFHVKHCLGAAHDDQPRGPEGIGLPRFPLARPSTRPAGGNPALSLVRFEHPCAGGSAPFRQLFIGTISFRREQPPPWDQERLRQSDEVREGGDCPSGHHLETRDLVREIHAQAGSAGTVDP